MQADLSIVGENPMFKFLDFRPFPGLSSPHTQMVLANYGPIGNEPPSTTKIIRLNDGDRLACKISTPPGWQPHHQTVVMVHGLGGSHQSSYMIRLSRKFYQKGIRAVRINLRGCGCGALLSRLPYNSGNSHDVLTVLKKIKEEHPLSPINLIGFSLGGNIILKMAGEIGNKALDLVNNITAVCPVLDLAQSIHSLSTKRNWLYHRYYVNKITQQGKKWLKDVKFRSIYEIDEKITAPLWGYASANDYYDKCSSYKFIPHIQAKCELILSADDPFIDYTIMRHLKIPPQINVWLSPSGGHMGYIGWTDKKQEMYWLDSWLLKTSGLSACQSG
jgi:uncharacterized protein